MKKNIDSKFVILILVLAVACAGLYFWINTEHKFDEQITNTTSSITQNIPDQEPIPSDELLGDSFSVPESWNTFIDEGGIFSVRYPDGYKFEKFQSPNNPPGYVELTGADECHPITIIKYTNSKNVTRVGGLLSLKGRSEEIFFAEYHLNYYYREVEEKTINNYPFIFSESMPYVIAAATVSDSWVIEIMTTDEYGGAYIQEDCRELFLKTLSTLTMLN